MLKHHNGFTLIELLVVIAIIDILSTMTVISLNGAKARARDAKRIADLQSIATALQLYYAEHGQYPDVSDTDDDIAGNPLGCWPPASGYHWDIGNNLLTGDDFIKELEDEGYLAHVPREENADITDEWNSHCIYRYTRISSPAGCTGETYAIIYAALETNAMPQAQNDEQPACFGAVASPWGKDHIVMITLFF